MIYINLPSTNIKHLQAIIDNQGFSEELIAEVQAAVITDMAAEITKSFIIIEDSYFDGTAVVEMDIETLPKLADATKFFSSHRQSFELELTACNDVFKAEMAKPITEWSKALIEHYIQVIVLFTLSPKDQLMTDAELKKVLLRKIIERLAIWEY